MRRIGSPSARRRVAHRGRDRVLITGGVAAGERIVTSDIGAPTEGMPLRAAGEDSDGG
ncbi:MAG: hypothetical protein U5L11_09255 [Arhodomonas sp.]|nr:hypothetical protein [Arhodomonas sp.]